MTALFTREIAMKSRNDRKRRPVFEWMEGRLAPSSMSPGGPPQEVRHDRIDNDRNDNDRNDNDRNDNDRNDNDRNDNDRNEDRNDKDRHGR
jgi:hypothetical protein